MVKQRKNQPLVTPFCGPRLALGLGLCLALVFVNLLYIMEEERYKIPLFDGNNFSDWNFRVQLQLDEQDLLSHVIQPLAALLEPVQCAEGDTAAQKRTKDDTRRQLVKADKKCKSFIVQRIQDGLLEVVKDKATAFDLWKALQDRFESKTATTRMNLSRDLHALSYKPKRESFPEFCLRFDKLIRSLRQAGESMDEEGAIIRFLLSMPEEYESVISALQTLVSKDLTMEFVRVRIEEYDTSKKRTTSLGLMPKSHQLGAAFVGQVFKRSDFSYTCNNCGIKGHRRIQCWKPGGGAYRSRGRGRASGARRGVHQGSRGRGSWTFTHGGRHTTNYIIPGSRGDVSRGRACANSRGYHGGSGNFKVGSFSGAKEEAVNASCAVAEDTEPVAYCFMSPIGDDHVSPAQVGLVQCNNVDKGEAQQLVALTSNEGAWYLDSGASDHMIQPMVPVVNRRQLKCPVAINIAKKSLVMHAYEQGDVIVYSEVQGTINKIHLKDCLIVKDLKFNLISVSRLEIKGFHILFSQGKCSIMEPNWNVLAEGLRNGRIYQLFIRTQNQVEVQPKCEAAAAVRYNNLWHKRLGHISQQSLLKLSSVVDGIDKSDLKNEVSELCEICIQGKQCKAPFLSTRNPTTRPLERIHSDLCGPINPAAYNGALYILTFIDDWTHFTVVFGLKSKSEVFEYIKLYEARVTSRFNLKVSIFRCDNGTEFVNNDVKQFFTEKGIQYELTIPGTPENNGVAERMNRTILDKSRCMLLESSLNKSFWIEAVMTAVYLINRSPTKGIAEDKVPAEKWFGKKPNLSNLRVFGCTAYLRMPKEQLGKFDSRSSRCIMLGYCTNGYRLWLVDKKRVISGRNVIFDESFNKLSKEGFLELVEERESIEECPQFANEESFLDIDQVEAIEHKKQPDVLEGSEEVQNVIEREENYVNEEIIVSEEEHNVSLPRKSCRIKLKPKYLQDYTVIACVAKFADQIDEAKLAKTTTINSIIGTECQNSSSCPEDTECFAFGAVDYCNNIPLSFQEIGCREDRELWLTAVQDELNSLEENNTWTLVPRPNDRVPIKNKWVFTVKCDGDGNVERYKARLVIKGCSQKIGIDYDETYAPVARLPTLRALLCVINKVNLFVDQLDVKNAFLNGILKEDIYMCPPEGMNVGPNLVCKLNRTLYGLKQAPNEWNKRFNLFAKEQGFRQCKADRCLYVLSNGGDNIYLLLYVDDFLIAGNNRMLIDSIKQRFTSEFKMRDLGELKYFLGIKITRMNNQMFLSQSAYLKKVLCKFKMENCAPVKTPLVLNPPYEVDTSKRCIIGEKPYRELIGSLMYACMATRPDLCTAVNFHSQFQKNATEEQWKGLKRILRYVQGTLELGICLNYKSNEPIVCYADADFANNFDRKSISGYVIEVFGSVVLWGTRKQRCVALSTTEAEYIALATATTEVLWLRQLFSEINISLPGPISIYEDNQSCIRALESWDQKRMKHIDIKYNFIRDLYQAKVISVMYIPSANQVADIMTKPLAPEVFNKHRVNLGLQESILRN